MHRGRLYTKSFKARVAQHRKREEQTADDPSAKASILLTTWPPRKADNSAITNHILTFGDFEKYTHFQLKIPEWHTLLFQLWLIVIVN